MAQYDLLLTQNVSAGVEYSEVFVNVAKGGLISAIADQTPTVLAGGTDGYVLVRDDAELTGLNWVDISSLGVSVTNQPGNDRIITATAVADVLNAEAQLTYNTSQGLLIGSGIGIVFTAAATTYQIYTPASAFTAGISIITGTNSAAGAGDITLKAGDGISAGGNVYFQRDTTWGNFFFGTGAAGHLPAQTSETDLVYYEPSTGKLSYGTVLWTDNTTYVSPPASYSVRTEGDNYGFFVDYTTQTGIRGQNNGDLEILASGNIIGRADGGTSTLYAYRELRVQLNGAPGPLLSFGGHTENYLQTGDSSVTGNLHIKTGDASAGGSGDLYLYIGSATGAPGNVYFGDSSAASCPLSENSSPTHVISINNSTGLLQWSAVGDVGGSSPWSVAANVITPAVAGDDVRLAANEQLQFVSTNDYITGSAGVISIWNGGSEAFRFAGGGTHQTFTSILPSTSGTLQLGDNSNEWSRVVTNILNLESTSYGIYLTTNAIVFEDTNGVVNLADLGTGDGTVTAVNNGNGMNFTNITTSGTVTLGTPGTLTSATSNGVTTSSHTHAITTGIGSTNIVKMASVAVDNDYAKFTSTGLEGMSYSELVSDIDASAFTFTNNNQHTAGYFKFADNVELEMGTGNDVSVYFNGSHLYFDSLIAATDIYFRTVTTQKFKFDMGSASGGIGTGLDWVATSDVRVKTNITPFELDMDQFLVLGNKAIRHNWKADPMGSSSIGFIAQDVERFFPELVSIGRDRPHMRALSYGKLVTVAIKATAQTWEYVVAVDGKLDVVRSEVEDLKIKIEELENKLNTIQNG